MEMYVLPGALFTLEWRCALRELRIRLKELENLANIESDMRVYRRPLILDLSHPTFDSANDWALALAAIGAPLLVLFTADRDCVSKLSRLVATASPCAVVCIGVNDAREEILDHIRSTRRNEISTALCERLGRLRMGLLPQVSAAIRRLLNDPGASASVGCLAEAAGMSRRSFDRYAAAA